MEPWHKLSSRKVRPRVSPQEKIIWWVLSVPGAWDPFHNNETSVNTYTQTQSPILVYYEGVFGHVGSSRSKNFVPYVRNLVPPLYSPVRNLPLRPLLNCQLKNFYTGFKVKHLNFYSFDFFFFFFLSFERWWRRFSFLFIFVQSTIRA